MKSFRKYPCHPTTPPAARRAQLGPPKAEAPGRRRRPLLLAMPECFVVIFLAALTRPHFQQKRYVIAMSLVVDFSNGANDGSPPGNARRWNPANLCSGTAVPVR